MRSSHLSCTVRAATTEFPRQKHQLLAIPYHTLMDATSVLRARSFQETEKDYWGEEIGPRVVSDRVSPQNVAMSDVMSLKSWRLSKAHCLNSEQESSSEDAMSDESQEYTFEEESTQEAAVVCERCFSLRHYGFFGILPAAPHLSLRFR